MKKCEKVTLYFVVHPDTKGRARVRVPVRKAGLIRQVMVGAGYREVEAEEYRAWVRKYPLAALDARVLEDEID